MSSKKKLHLAYGLAVIFLVLGVLCYAAFPAKTPDKPVRLMFQCAAGKVLFDHKIHLGDYDLGCTDCHHHNEEDESSLRACGECHFGQDMAADSKTCEQCHEPDEVSAEEVLQRTDAFHMQCIGCHKESEAGPEECAACHIM